MKKTLLPFVALAFTFSISGCGLMEDAFKAGFIIALIIAAVVGILIWALHITWKVLSRYFPVLRVFFNAMLAEEPVSKL